MSETIELSINAVIILCITFIVAKIENKVFKRRGAKDSIHIKFIKSLAVGATYIIGIANAIAQFSGFNKMANTLLAGSGVIAIVLSLGAQESFSNLISGIFISIFKPFNIGDKISLSGDSTSGFVEDITLRHTVIRTYTNVTIIIPNSVISSAKIENITYSEGVSYPIEVTIAYGSKDKRERAIEIMEETVKSHPLFYEKMSQSTKVLCTQFGDNGITLKIVMWTQNVLDNNPACSECRLSILDKFEEEGIEIPYNKIQIINENT